MYTSVKLFIGLFWLVVAAGIFGWQWMYPDRPGFTIWDTGVSIGWVALLFGLYNLVFWWVSRANQRQKLTIQEGEDRLRDQFQKRTRPQDVEPDPNFDFSDTIPPEKQT
jgi:hypothetical protein